MHRLPELRADLVEVECDPREGLDDSDSDDEVPLVSQSDLTGCADTQLSAVSGRCRL